MIPYDAAGRKLPGDGERNSRRGQNRHSTAARQLEAIWTRTRAGVLQPSGTGNVLVRPVPEACIRDLEFANFLCVCQCAKSAGSSTGPTAPAARRALPALHT